MKRSDAFLILLALCIFFGDPLKCFGEPQFRGRPLLAWLESYHAAFYDPSGSYYEETWNPEQSTNAANAIKAIGSNAVPVLLEWVQYEPPQGAFSQAENAAITNSEHKALLAVDGFKILGPTAASGVPALSNLLNTVHNLDTYESVIDSLGGIGKAAVPALAKANLHPHKGFRGIVAHQLKPLGTNAIAAVPINIAATRSKDPETASIAIWTLGYLGLEPRKCVPVLTSCLASPTPSTRIAAAIALAEFGPNAQSAVPALTKATHDPSAEVRKRANETLQALKTHRGTPAQ